MSEVRITIRFQCQPEHSEHWQVVCDLLGQGKFGWQLQDAIDPISVPAADALDEVWDKLSEGIESFECGGWVDGNTVKLALLTGGLLVEEIKNIWIPWLESCPVTELDYSLYYEY